MDNECVANWLKDIKEKYLHGGDETLDTTRKLAIDLAIERLKKQQEDMNNKQHMTTGDKSILYHVLDIYAYIISKERNVDDCKRFTEMLERLSKDLEYDFTNV